MQLTKAEYRKKNDNESLKIYIFNHFQGHFKNKNVLIYKNKIAVHVSHNMLSGGGGDADPCYRVAYPLFRCVISGW